MNRNYVTMIMVATLCSHYAWGEERLQLNKTTILGNGELPRVTFVVPWRDIPSKVPESHLSPADRPHPSPLDRDLYQRRLDYLRQIKQRREDAATQ